jgi:hypothetical protein
MTTKVTAENQDLASALKQEAQPGNVDVENQNQGKQKLQSHIVK